MHGVLHFNVLCFFSARNQDHMLTNSSKDKVDCMVRFGGT